MENLTPVQAYQAMIYYLENLYNLTGSDDLGGFLGSMALMQNGETMDPAAWSDWIVAVNKVLNA